MSRVSHCNVYEILNSALRKMGRTDKRGTAIKRLARRFNVKIVARGNGHLINNASAANNYTSSRGEEMPESVFRSRGRPTSFRRAFRGCAIRSRCPGDYRAETARSSSRFVHLYRTAGVNFALGAACKFPAGKYRGVEVRRGGTRLEGTVRRRYEFARRAVERTEGERRENRWCAYTFLSVYVDARPRIFSQSTGVACLDNVPARRQRYFMVSHLLARPGRLPFSADILAPLHSR